MKQEIQYNLLNLPSKITYSTNTNNPNVRMTDYTYSASGAKLSVTYTNGVTTTTNQYCGNMLYEQIREPSPDLMRGAGLYQIYERHSTSEWINGTTITSYRANQFGIVSPVSVEVLGSPYGDDPRDQYWINQGYNFK